jgi:hypothetical protein
MTLLHQLQDLLPLYNVKVIEYRIEKCCEVIYLSYKIDITRDREFYMSLGLSAKLIDMSEHDIKYKMNLEKREKLSKEVYISKKTLPYLSISSITYSPNIGFDFNELTEFIKDRSGEWCNYKNIIST